MHGAGGGGADDSDRNLDVDALVGPSTHALREHLLDLDRVEILRGPQGTLWGKNTTGGAINFVSRKPQFEEGNGYFKLDAGNYDSRLYEGAYGGTLVDDRLAARVAFVDQSKDGQLKNIVDGHTVGDVHDQAVRAQILNLLKDLQEELGLTMLFISHDLPVIRQMCDRVGVMRYGELLEVAATEDLFERPQHPYSKHLLGLMPRLQSMSREGLDVVAG